MYMASSIVLKSGIISLENFIAIIVFTLEYPRIASVLVAEMPCLVSPTISSMKLYQAKITTHGIGRCGIEG
jgi:hypothetical protein